MFSKFLSLESERRNALLNSALREFAKKGFSDASTNVIARESGISKPLMFHYVNNKKDFFLFLYDYCLDILQKEYFDKVNLAEIDLFERLRQTSLLKIKVMQKYPWIFDFIKMAVCDESEIMTELLERREKVEANSLEKFYSDIDVSRFKDNLDIKKAKQLIFWAVGGYAEQVLNRVKNLNLESINLKDIQNEFDEYLNELRKAYYK
ncbi:MAG: TetR/AcrR family transcriptional regulator [Tissierella sp.]|uniref:TetR/AcrR family transcriptional regulator n=1 Tax=Tissierella sp. TaxID=41274 RepID=UPI003F967126